MKSFLLKCSTKVAVVAGVVFMAIAVALWCQGTQDSRKVASMAEELGKMKAGGSSYPTDRVDYDLVLRVLGQDTWVRKAINVEREDLIEVGLRVASADSVSVDTSGISVLLRSPELKESNLQASSYESPDPSHVTYIPIGIYEINYGAWPHDVGTCVLGVFYDRADGATDYAEVYLVPPCSELENTAILVLSFLGIVCVAVIAPITSHLRYRFG